MLFLASRAARRRALAAAAALAAVALPAGPARAQSGPSADFAAIRTLAERGDNAALTALGTAYMQGKGAPQDFPAALTCYRKAAGAGFAPAQFYLGYAYELGLGTPANEGEAQRWYRAAADQGHTLARYSLAVMLEEGHGSAPDPAGAAELYRAAALQGYVPAQNSYGLMLAQGRGMAADPVEAYAWLSLACEGGMRPDARDVVAEQLDAAGRSRADARLAELRRQIRPGPPESKSVRSELARLVAKLSPEPVRPPPGQDPDELARQLAEARSQVVALAAERDKLAADKARLAAENSSLSERMQGLQKEASETADRLAAQTRREDSEKADAERRLAQLRKAAAESPSSADLAAAGERAASLQRELDGLKELPAKYDAAVQAAAQVKQQLDAATAQMDALQAQVEKLRAENASLAASAQPPAPAAAPAVAAAEPGPAPTGPAAAAATPAAPRTYTVREGDSLTRISLACYGTARRWREIYEANRDVLPNENTVQVGQELKIP